MSEWTTDENTKSTNNQKALNSIFTAISSDKFQLVSHCTSAKQAWDILQVTHEGTASVRESKLQQLITQFENMKMGDDEKFADFCARLRIVVNGCYNLGDLLPQDRIVNCDYGIDYASNRNMFAFEGLRDAISLCTYRPQGKHKSSTEINQVSTTVSSRPMFQLSISEKEENSISSKQ